ncbi:hypothetical protein CEXT_726991 [Caerostris extrusa]|uniref:Uncharacterized protein n=1 Tax=Caerostris extrusa TaxID=172846 RepID=A0AAV4Y2V2_CAEEX|nr:hypothetical protein CEXT_726991 [Caerostris extrusa]
MSNNSAMISLMVLVKVSNGNPPDDILVSSQDWGEVAYLDSLNGVAASPNGTSGKRCLKGAKDYLVLKRVGLCLPVEISGFLGCCRWWFVLS